MSEAKHTPGPWVWSSDGLYGTETGKVHDGMTCLECGHEGHECGPPVITCVTKSVCDDIANGLLDLSELAPTEADTRLIAAAPDLLEACEAIVAWDEAEKAARPWNEDGGKGWHERLDACALAFEKARAAIAKATGGTTCG